MSTELVADAILAGTLAPDAWIAAPGGYGWLRAYEVPVIARLLEGVPTKPTPRARSESGLRTVEGAGPAPASAEAPFGSTMMLVDDLDELELDGEETMQMKAPLPFDEMPETEPVLPPPSSKPLPLPRAVSPYRRG